MGERPRPKGREHADRSTVTPTQGAVSVLNWRPKPWYWEVKVTITRI